MIRPALENDLPNILPLYSIARAYMRSEGNIHQWNGSYPSEEILLEDIRLKQLYVITDGSEIHGVFVFFTSPEPTYARIEGGAWKNDLPYGTIHRIASDGKTHGIFGECIRYCFQQVPSLRIDTHKDNRTMQHLVLKNGFEYCGIIHLKDGNERLAFQYTPAGC